MDSATATLITVIGGLIYQGWRAERQRKWDVADRLSIAATLATHTTATAAKVAEALATRTTDTSEELKGLIAENTKISTDAFHEANSVNLKIASLGLEHNKLDAAEAARRNRRATDPK